jgi:hypothetical protein
LLKGLDNPNTQSILNYYASYIFSNVPKPSQPAFELIVKHWLQVEDADMEGFKTYWFLFTIIIKSMVLHLDSLGKLKSKRKHEYFSSTYKADIESLLPRLLKYAGTASLISFPVFVTNLFGLLSAGQVFKMVCGSLSSHFNQQ